MLGYLARRQCEEQSLKCYQLNTIVAVDDIANESIKTPRDTPSFSRLFSSFKALIVVSGCKIRLRGCSIEKFIQDGEDLNHRPLSFGAECMWSKSQISTTQGIRKSIFNLTN